MPRILVNTSGLPEPIFKAVEFESYQKRGHISVTTLIDSPKINYLKTMFEYHEDVADMIWALRGQALHHILERSAIQLQKTDEAANIESRYIPEFKMEYEWKEDGQDPVMITGTLDLLYKLMPGIIYDYKDCSFYKISGCDKTIDENGLVIYKPRKGECVDWIKQLNIYAFFLRKKYNITVAKLRVIALLKDWSKKNIYQQGYPPMPIVIVDLPLYGDEVIEKYISNRIALHREYYKIAKENGVDAMPACSPEERWKKSDTIKIYATPDASKSSKNFKLNGTEEENKASEIAAKLFFENLKVTKPNAIMKVISGFDGRCNDYCKVNIHCHYYKNLVAKK